MLRWYDRHARPLPWRRDRDPYRVWVAEVMLQQTRIAAVVPAYERFLAAFPSVEHLAAASEDDVLSSWSGLGYYARARALRRAAIELAGAGGSFPSDYRAARRLPGVGDYTACAVLSIAYGLPLAAVDGNVVRVLSRLFRLSRPGAKGEPHRSLAARLLPPGRPGDWNQAIMELGETVCTPGTPACGKCPLRRFCGAFRHGEPAAYPSPAPRRKMERIAVRLMLARDRRGRLLLERGAFPYLRHLWLPPIEVLPAAAPLHPSFKHAILHREFHVEVRERRLGARELRRLARTSGNGVQRALFAPADLGRIGRAALLTKALRVTSPVTPSARP